MTPMSKVNTMRTLPQRQVYTVLMILQYLLIEHSKATRCAVEMCIDCCTICHPHVLEMICPCLPVN